MNIGVISLNSGGTAGHMTLTTQISTFLSDVGHQVHLLTDTDYSSYLETEHIGYNLIQIKDGPHKEAIGGCFDYGHCDYLISIIKQRRLSVVIFSTFYDLSILDYCRANRVRTVLVSYPLRDSHREAIRSRGFFRKVDFILTLKDIFDVNRIASNEIMVSPLRTELGQAYSRDVSEFNVLITCGGGGRPSSEFFYYKVEILSQLIAAKYPDCKFTIIKGNSEYHLAIKNSKILSWTSDFTNLLSQSNLVISEAGYYTLVDIVSLGKRAILIPGERKIDNQELRAVKCEQKGFAMTVFPLVNERQLNERLELFLKDDSGVEKGIHIARKSLFSEPSLSDSVLGLTNSWS